MVNLFQQAAPLIRISILIVRDRWAVFIVTQSMHKGGVVMIDRELIEKELQKREAAYDSASDYLEKTSRIKKEKARLRRLFKEVDDNKKKLVYSTIDDIAFMAITMKDLQDRIIRNGTISTYQNGENQYGTKQSPDAQLYLQMSQKHTQAMKILMDCLPKTERTVHKDDGFEDFVYTRDK